jgi:hypothetical protein
MLKRSLILLFAVAFCAPGLFAQTSLSTTEVDWFNSGTTLFLDQNGVALSQGTGNINTDGRLVQLGYFSAGTALNNFAGTWNPLTGATFGQLPTSPSRTAIGDSSANLAGGSGNGRIAFTTVFHFGSNLADVYDPAFDTGAYTTQSSATIGLTTPPNGQVLAIRFYNSNDASGKYNTVSADNWTWQTPTDVGQVVLVNLTTSPLEWESVFSFGLTGTEFRTVLPIPEPSTLACLLLGGAGTLALGARRRFKS